MADCCEEKASARKAGVFEGPVGDDWYRCSNCADKEIDGENKFFDPTIPDNLHFYSHKEAWQLGYQEGSGEAWNEGFKRGLRRGLEHAGAVRSRVMSLAFDLFLITLFTSIFTILFSSMWTWLSLLSLWIMVSLIVARLWTDFIRVTEDR